MASPSSGCTPLKEGSSHKRPFGPGTGSHIVISYLFCRPGVQRGLWPLAPVPRLCPWFHIPFVDRLTVVCDPHFSPSLPKGIRPCGDPFFCGARFVSFAWPRFRSRPRRRTPARKAPLRPRPTSRSQVRNRRTRPRIARRRKRATRKSRCQRRRPQARRSRLPRRRRTPRRRSRSRWLCC